MYPPVKVAADSCGDREYPMSDDAQSVPLGPQRLPEKSSPDHLRITNTHLLDGNVVLIELSDDSTISMTLEQILTLPCARTQDHTGEPDSP